MRIKDLADSERPRERLKKQGSAALSNTELLALVLRQGFKKENVLEVSQQVLHKNNLRDLSRKTVSELMEVDGIGEAKACQLVASFELGRRLASFSNGKKVQIKEAKDVFALLGPEMSTLKKEHFRVLYLDARKNVIKNQTVFVGSLDATIVHPREIFQLAITEGAAAVILVHNHPSGDPRPSDDDIIVTKEIVAAGKLLGIEVLDHVIIGDGSFTSLREKNVFS